MKKTIVAVLGVAFAFSAVAASAATTYTRDLTIGSTGADVTSLQTTLASKGFLVIPANVSKGYFGGLTKTALMNYQKSVGIAPAVGYFGPVTRAHFNAMTDGGDVDNGGDDNDSGLQGGEGDIKDFDILGNPSSTDLDEGESDKVLGFEFEARDSDIAVERLEILASSSAGISSTASDQPWDYIESARLLMGSEEVAEVTGLDDEDAWDEESNDHYSFRFEDLEDAIVEEDETVKFYVEFTAVDNLDSDDENTDFDISLTDDGLRAVDAEGIDIYEGVDTDEVTVTFGGAEEGDLDLSIDDSDNEDRTVFVDENSSTDGVEIMRFTLESNTSDNTVDQLDVVLATTTSTTTQLADVISSLRLEVDGDEISSESVPGSSVGGATVSFEDLEDDFVIAEDEEIEVVVLADIDEQEGNYGEGYAFEASVAGSSIDAEDANGDSVTVSGSVTGGDIELRVNGMTVELVSAEAKQIAQADPATAGSADKYEYSIKFEVSASGDDVFVDKSVQRSSSPSTAGAGASWATTTESTASSTATNSSTLSATGSTTGDTSNVFKVNDGSTRSFTLKVVLQGTADGSTAVKLTGINWTNDSADTTPDEYYTFALDDFQTDLQYIDFI